MLVSDSNLLSEQIQEERSDGGWDGGWDGGKGRRIEQTLKRFNNVSQYVGLLITLLSLDAPEPDAIPDDLFDKEHARFLKTQYTLSPVNSNEPTSIVITTLLDRPLDDMIRSVLKCFIIPYRVYIDVWGVTESFQGGEIRREILYPTKVF